MRRRTVAGPALLIAVAATAGVAMTVATARHADDGRATITTIQGAPREAIVDTEAGRAFVVTNGSGMFGISDGTTTLSPERKPLSCLYSVSRHGTPPVARRAASRYATFHANALPHAY